MIQNQLNNLPPKLAVCSSGGRSVYFSNYWQIKIQVQFDHKCDVMEDQSISGQEPNKNAKFLDWARLPSPFLIFFSKIKPFGFFSRGGSHTIQRLWMVWDPPLEKNLNKSQFFCEGKFGLCETHNPLGIFSKQKHFVVVWLLSYWHWSQIHSQRNIHTCSRRWKPPREDITACLSEALVKIIKHWEQTTTSLIPVEDTNLACIGCLRVTNFRFQRSPSRWLLFRKHFKLHLNI